MQRRGLLGGMAALFAAPVAKNIPPQIENISDPLRHVGVATAVDAESLANGLEAASKKTVERYNKKLLKNQALRFFKPSWFVEQKRSYANNVQELDLDLATHRSMSVAAKIAIQKERNFQRYMSDESDNWMRWRIESGADGDDDIY